MSWVSSKSGFAALQNENRWLGTRSQRIFYAKKKNISAESGPCHNSRACLNMCCSRHGNIDYWNIIDRFTLISPFLSHKSHNSMSGHTKICRNRRLKKPMSWQCFAKHLCSTEPTPSKKHSALDLCQSVCESAFFKLPSVQA